MTFRRLQVLIDNLPPESATHTAIREGYTDEQLAEMGKNSAHGYGRWARIDYWMASLSDRLDQLMYIYLRVNGGKPDEPTPLPRPGLVIPRGDITTPPDPALIALLEQRRAERRQQQEHQEQADSEAPADAGASLSCGCPHSVLETGHHSGGCAVLDALQPPEQE